MDLANQIILVYLGPVIAAVVLVWQNWGAYKKTKAEIGKIQASTTTASLPPATSPSDAQEKMLALVTTNLEATSIQLKDTYAQLVIISSRADNLSTALDDCRDRLRGTQP